LNGGIEMEEVGGSGTVSTLNGPVKVAFSRNPTRSSEFHSLNGKVEVYFQPGLNADVNFHTLNGGIYTDFEVTTRPTQMSAGGKRNWALGLPFGPAADGGSRWQRWAGTDIRYIKRRNFTAFKGVIEDQTMRTMVALAGVMFGVCALACAQEVNVGDRVVVPSR